MCNDGIQVKLVIIQLVVYDNSSSLLFITLFYANIDIFLLATIRFLLTCYVFSLLLLLILYLNAELYYLCYYANKVTSMGGKTKRAMLSERSEVGSRDVSVSYGAMS